MAKVTRADFEAFVASVPNVAVRGMCDLRTCISDSALTNAGDTPGEPYWEIALATARMIADDWRSFYSDLAAAWDERPEITGVE